MKVKRPLVWHKTHFLYLRFIVYPRAFLKYEITA